MGQFLVGTRQQSLLLQRTSIDFPIVFLEIEGNFSRVLTGKVKGSRAQIVEGCLKKTHIGQSVNMFKWAKNMHERCTSTSREFGDMTVPIWLLQLGGDKLP